jgi:UDP-glucuronate 4-epimerase
MSIDDKASLDALFEREQFDKVVNLAAQAGVRYSITNPYAYLQSNLVGFLNILEACRHFGVKHLVYASSSSVYGMNEKVPYSEDDKVVSPVSLYAASKKSNELMAHAYSKLYGFATTGLRYFTVYGPWGRPDMSPMLFASAISQGKPIKVFNNGDMIRDFTYIDDIVEGTICVIDHQPEASQCEHGVPYKVYNIGCSHPVRLMDFISEIEQAYGREAEKIFLPMQPGDVYQTYADTTKLETECGYKPHWTLHDGIQKFMEWYKSEKNPLRIE